jgi:hypothetical protein
VENDHGSSSCPSRCVGSTKDLRFSLHAQPSQIRSCIAPWSALKSAHVSTPEASLMEFIIVRVKNQPNIQASVLINGQRNGTTGALITLGSPGWVFISVDLPNARQQDVNVTNTTATHPMDIEIDCN